MQRRDKPSHEKDFPQKDEVSRGVSDLLEEIHQNLLRKATEFRDANMSFCDDGAAFEAHWQGESPGWLCTPWAGDSAQEEEISKRLKISIRCLPLESVALPAHVARGGTCFLTGKPGAQLAIWGRSY